MTYAKDNINRLYRRLKVEARGVQNYAKRMNYGILHQVIMFAYQILKHLLYDNVYMAIFSN